MDKAEQESELAQLLNAKAPELLSRACKKQGIWLLQISTDYVFDGHKSEAYCEVDPASPVSIYGKTKLSGEQAVLAASSDNLIIRTSWVFSEYSSNFLKTMLRLATERDHLRIVNDQRGGPTYAPHIAEMLIQLVDLKYNKKKIIEGGIYHFSGYPTVSWYEFSLEIFNVACKTEKLNKVPMVEEITTANFPTPAKRPFNSELNNSKINTLGIRLKSNWKEALIYAICKI